MKLDAVALQAPKFKMCISYLEIMFVEVLVGQMDENGVSWSDLKNVVRLIF